MTDLRQRSIEMIEKLLALRRPHDKSCPLMHEPSPSGPCKCPVGKVGGEAMLLVRELKGERWAP